MKLTLPPETRKALEAWIGVRGAASGSGLYKAGGVYTLDAFTLMHIINNTDSNNDSRNDIGP
jgi:hypothetical protein